MELLNNTLPIVIDFLLVIVLIISIILLVKFIITINKVNRIVDNVEDKVNSLNGLFNIVEAASSKVTGIYSKVIDFAASTVEKLFMKNKNKEGDEEDYE